MKKSKIKLTYVTGNASKFDAARKFFKKHESQIEIVQEALSIDEIQAEDSIKVAMHKAERAFDLLKKPLFVNDAGWQIPALGAFPGPYMKFINQWFSAEDFINLMRGKENREIILHDIIVFVDKNTCKVFENKIKGVILGEAYKSSSRHPSDCVISFSKDGKSVAQKLKEGDFLMEGEERLWNKFADYLLCRGG